MTITITSAEWKPLIYLASPYTSSAVDEDTRALYRESRFLAVSFAAGELFRQGFYVFCPIAMSHPIASVSKLDGAWDFWEQYDLRMVESCDIFAVLMLPGWQESRGVAAETDFAERKGLPIHYLPYAYPYRIPDEKFVGDCPVL